MIQLFLSNYSLAVAVSKGCYLGTHPGQLNQERGFPDTTITLNAMQFVKCSWPPDLEPRCCPFISLPSTTPWTVQACQTACELGGQALDLPISHRGAPAILPRGLETNTEATSFIHRIKPGEMKLLTTINIFDCLFHI